MNESKKMLKEYEGKERENNYEFEMMDEFVEDYNNGDFSIEDMVDLERLSDLIRNTKKEAISPKVVESLQQLRETDEFAYNNLSYLNYKKGWNEALQTMTDWIYMYAPKINELEEKGLYATTALASQLNMVFKMK